MMLLRLLSLYLTLLLSISTLSAKTIFVSASNAAPVAPFATWETASTNLQDALTLAVSGDEIWVATGTYYPDEGGGKTNNDRSATFSLKSGVSIYGGFKGDETLRSQAYTESRTTTLSGDIDQSGTSAGNSYHILTAFYIDEPTALQEFVIKDGNADGASNPYDRGGAFFNNNVSATLSIIECYFEDNHADYGGAIQNVASSPSLIRCTFKRNSASVYGGAIHNLTSSDPTITDCYFNENTSVYGGAILNESSAPTITDCTFWNGEATANGGAIHNFSGSSPTIEGCDFNKNEAGNYGGAIINQIDSLANITNCLFRGNSANRGGAILNDQNASPELTNCAFTGNKATTFGGAISSQISCSPTLVNCSFQGNQSGSVGGAIFSSHSSILTLTNCIIWDNMAAGVTTTTSASVFSQISSDPSFSHCLVENYSKATLDATGSSPNNNYEPLDPLFSDPASPTFAPTIGGIISLLPGSPAIDAGNRFANSSSEDLDGNTRVLNSEIDLGAYEGTRIEVVSWVPASVPLHASSLSVDFTITTGSLPDDWEDALDVTSTGSATFITLSVTGTGPAYTITLNGLDGEGFFTIALDNDKAAAKGIFPAQGQSLLYLLTEDSTSEPILRSSALTQKHYVNAANASPAAPYDSWATAATSLQDALVYASTEAGDSIWVAAGTYYPDQGDSQTDDDRTATFQLKNNVAIYGGFIGGETELSDADPTANKTILSGDIDQNDGNDFLNSEANSYQILTATDIDATAWLQGFTIQGGNADGTFPANNGSAIRLSNSSPRIVNCVFQENLASVGGAISSNVDSSPSFTNCSFTGNRAETSGGAILNTTNSSPIFSNCSFQRNQAETNGGAIINFDSSPTFTNCSFLGNIAIKGGAIFNSSSSPTLTNCSFQGNKANNGGAIYNQNASLSLTNCSFQGNKANNGGAIYNLNASASLTNCIIWNNAADGATDSTSASIENIGTSAPTFSYSIVANYSKATLDANGTNNLEPTDPLFLLEVDPATAPTTDGNLHLLGNSPAQDQGDSSANATTTDLAGNARIQNVAIDLGAYETVSAVFNSWVLATPVANDATSLVLTLTLTDGSLPNGWENTIDVTTTQTAAFSGLSVTGTGPVYTLTLHALSGDGQFTFAFDTAAANELGITLSGATELAGVERHSSATPIHYVNAANATPAAPYDTWANASTSLQDVLAIAAPGDQIWVAAGTYYPDFGSDVTNDDRSASFQLKNGVAIYGGFQVNDTDLSDADPAANETILSGDIDQNDGDAFLNSEANSYHVLTGASIDGTARLDGFTIRDGNADGPSSTTNAGGGIYLSNSSPTIANCVFQENKAAGGGAIFNFSGSSPSITNCSFQGNEASSVGGAIHSYQSSPSFTNCTFQGNKARSAGAISNVVNSSPSFTNCSFQGNHAAAFGGAFRNDTSNPTLVNSIIWNNREFGSTDLATSSVLNIGGSVVTYSHSLVANFTKAELDASGSNNFAPTDPLFLLESDPALAPTSGGNLRLRTGSPALNAGDNAANVTTTDLAGNPRIQNTTIDLGAYERAVAAANSLEAWIANYPGVGAETGYDDDPDRDGQPSGLENFFGTDPSSFSVGMVPVEASEGVFTVTHPQGASPANDLTFAYEWTTDLISFYPTGATNMAGTTTVTSAISTDTPTVGTTTITFTVSGSEMPTSFFVVISVDQDLGK